LGNVSDLHARGPGMPEISILGMVPDFWGRSWQSRHFVLSRLAKYFHVVWHNPTYGWREACFLARSRDPKVSLGDTGVVGLRVYHPGRWLPKFYRPRFLADFTQWRRLKDIRQMLNRHRPEKTVLYLWRPGFAWALDRFDYDISCYHIDDEYTFSFTEKPVSELEVNLISQVDQVFIHSSALMEKKGAFNPHTLLVPNGVDAAAYSTPVDEPADMKPIPHPRIGYIGYIKTQLDFQTSLALAKLHPQWSFVFVGPMLDLKDDTACAQELFGLPNVYWLGGKPVDELPGYTQHMDVCTMCYKVNDYTKFIYPLKVHEYLATGRPVVGSPIRSLLEMSGNIATASTIEQWSDALAVSLLAESNSAEKVKARQETARKNDWDDLVLRIARAICERLGPEYVDRLQTLTSAT